MTLDEIKDLMRSVKYGDWKFHVGMHDGPFLQIKFWAIDNDTGQVTEQCCRKWKLSPHMTKSEIIFTAWKAVQAAVEHEARETFLYNGRRVFGPHIDIDSLWQASATLDARKAP